MAEWASTRYPGANFFLTPTRVWELGMGVMTAVWMRGTASRPHPLLAEAGAAAGLAMILLTVFLFDEEVPFPSLFALLPTGGAVLLILFAHPGNLVGRLLSNRILVGVGLISYSAYLWHQPLFAFARLRLSEDLDPLVISLLIALTFGLSYVSWRFVERPFRQRSRVSRRMVFGSAGIAITALVGVGLTGVALQGLPQRFPAGDRSLVLMNIQEMGRYNYRIFDQLWDRDFDQDGAVKKVLLVGDSHARDFVNALVAADPGGRLDISTHGIPKVCGIATEADAEPHVPLRERERCARIDRFRSDDLVRRVREADHVILVQSWEFWTVEALPRTLAFLRDLGARDVIVVGRKNFGRIVPYDFLGKSTAERVAFRNPVTDEQRAVNRRMLELLGDGGFVDVAELLCDGGERCPVFTPEGELISYDGGHLTPAGARYFGSRVMRHPLFSGLDLPGSGGS